MPQRQGTTEPATAQPRIDWQERFECLKRMTGAVVWCARPDDQDMEAARRWSEFSGRPPSDLLDEKWLAAVHPDERATVTDSWRKGRTDPDGFSEIFRLRRHDGEYLWMHMRSTPRLDGDGEVSGWLGVMIDTDLHDIRERLLQREASLERALDDTVAVLGSLVELRDPYTAGHQRRVAALALAIAEKLGEPPAEIRTLRTAALLHDIGKITCPSEILSKPTRLSEAEMLLVRTHAAAGGAIVAGIHCADPVVPAVVQHHERLDGSGYPAGIGGEEIVPGARVIAVADVVEAMASHRPYRAALGVPAALAEVDAGRGRLYWSEAVDACIELFAEGFALNGAVE